MQADGGHGLDQQNEENIGRGGPEGITYDVVSNAEARVTAAPEMKQNEAYSGGLTSLQIKLES